MPRAAALGLLAACFLAGPISAWQETGLQTEKRFPPLKVPPGFRATLFACDPLIEYPSVVSLGPRPGSVFISHDYMTGLGIEIVRRDEVRLVEDTDGDGHADKSTVYAGGFNSIQGLAYHAGSVTVMHAPFLTALRDTNGDGVADERRDLLEGLGWTPEKAPDRLHGANGVVVGHDGWLYLALGDRGCDIRRPEGDRLVHSGGAILRCRPDGRDLHVFAFGLRNIYDVALDEELNVFVRDNENDGGTYMVRVCHSFFGADHGYPYLYEDRADEALPPLADLGRGSSAGGVCYLETAFPPEHRGDLYFCEWGRSVVRYRRERAGATFAPMKQLDFAAGGDTDPYGFKPTDVIVDYDGSLVVSDWGDDQRPKRGRGRLYRIRYGTAPAPAAPAGERSLDDWIAQLDSESSHARIRAQGELSRRGADVRPALQAGRVGVLGRLHSVWLIADRESLLSLAERDPDPRVRAQSVRAIADLADPVLVEHRLDAGRGDAELARKLAALGRGQDPRVALEVLIALGRLRWTETPEWIRENVKKPDAALAHAAMQALRRSGNWTSVLKLLDLPEPLSSLARRAIAGQADAVVVDDLIERLGKDGDPRRRRDFVDALARVCRKPGPWVYWGFRPGPRPANTEAWDRTAAIEEALDRALGDPDRVVRRFALRSLQREKINARTATLIRLLREERDPETVALLLGSLREAPGEAARDAAEGIARDRAQSPANRLAALSIFVQKLDKTSDPRLLPLAESLEDAPALLVEALLQLGRRPKVESRAFLRRALGSPTPEVRKAAIDALAALESREDGPALIKLLGDPAAPVRAAAASALGRLAPVGAIEPLLKSTDDKDAAVRRQGLDALRRLREPRAVPKALGALADQETQIAALECLAELGGPEQGEAVVRLAERERSIDVLRTALTALSKWTTTEPALERGVARVHGASGLLLRWSASGPLLGDAATKFAAELGRPSAAAPGGWTPVLAAGAESAVTLAAPESSAKDVAWIAFVDIVMAAPTKARFMAGSSGPLQVWLNGRPVYRRAEAGAFRPESDRFEADLEAGPNRLLVQLSGRKPQFHARFRSAAASADHERLTQLALTGRGNVDRGREIFFNPQKPGCAKCHRLGEAGGRLGPDLTGVGRRFSKIHLVESILEPSRTIAPAFQNWAVRLKDGRILNGVKVAEAEAFLTLGDAEGQVHTMAKKDIDELKALALSVMPEGIEKALTDRDFLDLIAFLAAQR